MNDKDQKKTKLPLPPELIVHISKYLNVQDKLNLRLINKTFKFVFDNLIKLDCLTIISNQRSFNGNWFYTNRSNKEIDLIRLDNNSNLTNLFKKQFILSVRKLFFKQVQLKKSFNLDETINKLKHLEELNLECKLESNSKLILPKLRILEIYYHLCVKLELETPLLSILRSINLEKYQINYPKKLTNLQIFGCFGLKRDFDKIVTFNNLNYFSISPNYNYQNFNLNLLNKLNQLKELHIHQISNMIKYFQITKQIYEYKLKLKMNNLRIFLCGIDFKNLNNLKEDQLIDISELDLIFRYYSKTIDILPFVDKMDFDKLNEFLNCNQNISLDNLIYKFPNIKEIISSNLNKENVDCFLEFLSKYDNLSILVLNSLTNNQIYYLDKLSSNSCKSIFELYLNGLNIDYSTNLEFLFKFKNLSYLLLGKLDGVYNLKKLQNQAFTDFEFIYRGHSFFIQRYVCNDTGNDYYYDGKAFDSVRLIKHLDYLIDECNYTSNEDGEDFNEDNEE